MRHLLVLALLVAARVASAQPAAPVDPVLAHFREYRAALQRNDLPAAETAAAAALAASEAANGARTAVLAQNLATLRLELGGNYDALTPARTAHALAAAADSGVDTRVTALTLGRAELAAGDSAGAQHLLDAFAAATAPELERDVYDAAVALGTWAFEAQDHGTARLAWEKAASLANTTQDPPFARARALTGLGAAAFFQTGAPRREGERPTRAERGDPRVARAANDAFAEAVSLLAPTALSAEQGAQITLAKVAYAQALAWQDTLLAKLERSGDALPNAAAPANPAGLCSLRAITEPLPVHTEEMLAGYGAGAAVVHLGLDASGAIVNRTLVAAIPSGALGDAVMATATEWRVEKDPASPADCRMPPSLFARVRFVGD